jgi:uncharacterized protein (TIGR01244 family)
MRTLFNIFLALATAIVVSLALAENPAQSIDKTGLPGVSNYSRVEQLSSFAGSTVGFGGTTDPAAMAGLRAAGFATVINLRTAGEPGIDLVASRAAAEAAGLTYIHLPMDTGNLAPGTIDGILETVGERSNQPVYLHCGSATRVAAVWMIGRVLEDGLTAEEAGAEAAQIAGYPDRAIDFANRYLATRTGDAP